MRHLWLVLWLLASLYVPQAFAEDEGVEGEAAVPATTYFDVKPAFVVNYGGPGKLRYIKTDISLRVGGGDIGMQGIRHHLPYIRHTLVMLLTKQSVEDISTTEGKELIRQAALEAVQQMLEGEEGEQHVVDLLFNSFIVQR